ncbi:MAG: response regulator [Nitrospira sp.]
MADEDKPQKQSAISPLPNIFSSEQLREVNERLTLATLRANEQADEVADRFRDLVEGLDAIVWEAEAQPWQFSFVSQRAEAMLGYPIERWLTEPDFWIELVHPDDREQALLACSASPAPDSDFRIEFRMVGADGRTVWLAMIARARLTTGSRKQFRGLLIDVGDSVRAAALQKLVREQTEEVVTHQARLRALATELNLAEHRARTELASELHDHLAQLLALGRMKVGQAQRLPGVDPACLALIEQTASALDDALTYTRTLVATLTPPVLHQFGLSLALRWLSLHMRRYDLVVDVDGTDIPELALSENQAVLLFQSVRELLINVSKHAETGHATVRLQGENGLIRIIVRDEGRGFDVPSSDANTIPSSRFGLFSIRERMKALGGSFEVAAAPGKGCTVTLTLPLEASKASTALRDGVLEPAANQQFLPSDRGSHDSIQVFTQAIITVLLVDDHAMVRQGLRGIVNSCAHLHVVGEASDGVEAIAAVRRLQPQVVVMDINMPRMNGIEATTRIKTEFPSMAIIGLSVHHATQVADQMKQAGIFRYLTKDLAAEDLCKAIEEAVGIQD